MTTLLLGIDQRFGFGLFHRDQTYHGNTMTSLLFSITDDFFLSKLSTVLVVDSVSDAGADLGVGCRGAHPPPPPLR